VAWVRGRLWVWVLLLGAALAVTYFLLPTLLGPTTAERVQPFLWLLAGLMTVAAVLLGALGQPVVGRAGWALLAVTIALNVAGDAVYVFPTAFGQTRPLDIPSVADLFYLASYVTLATGVLVLTRHRVRRDDRVAVLDALVVTAAAGLAAWMLLVQPALSSPSGSVLPSQAAIAVAVAYPVADLVIVAVAARLWFAVESGGNRSLQLLLGGLLLTLLADTTFSVQMVTGGFGDATTVGLGWYAFYLLVAAAALHPDAAAPTVATTREQETGSWRFVGLQAVAVAVPFLLLLSLGSWPDGADVAVVVAGGAVILALVLARADGLLRELRATLRRERTMREANVALSAAGDREAIRAAAIRAAQALVPDSTVWLIAPLPSPTQVHSAVVVAAADGTAVGVMLDHPTTQLLGTASASSIELDEPTPLHHALQVAGSTTICVAPVTDHERVTGYLTVASPLAPRPEVLASLQSLGDAVGLANARFDLSRAQAQRRSERRVRTMLEHASDVIAVLDQDLSVRYVTPAAERLLGSPTTMLIGGSWLDLVLPVEREMVRVLITRSQRDRPTHGEVRLVAGDGTPRYVDVVASQVVDDEEPGYVLTCHDVTERRALEKQLAHQAFHDSLTGLANRALFTDRLEQALVRRSRSDRQFAVLFVDLDDFKDVNDSLGHAAGDDLLRQVTDRLNDVLREEDTAARLGGDEFALLLDDVAGEEDAQAVAERLIAAMARPFAVNGSPIMSSISIGIALSTADTDSAQEVMRNADLALYEAKNLGKDRYASFVPVMHEQAMDRLQLTADLRRALDAHELVVHYQPIVDLRSQEVLGVEALVRWQHPQRGLLPPAQFVALAEETGLVVPMGRQVLSEALRAVAGWQRADAPGLLASVNLSARQLQHDDIVGEVAEAVASSGIDPATVMLEITESVLLPDEGVTVERLRALADVGVRLFIDDFGTGYSSLSYLQQLPVHGIKLAREFVATLTASVESGPGDGTASSTGLVSTIRALAETLGLASIIAEGVETEGQRAALLDLGYRVGQGFLLARPMPGEQLGRLLRSGLPAITAMPASEPLPAGPSLVVG
jgi:diguanylate cyclase (GGDEF)-like protein/PAS domain S-box-containing protein